MNQIDSSYRSMHANVKNQETTILWGKQLVSEGRSRWTNLMQSSVKKDNLQKTKEEDAGSRLNPYRKILNGMKTPTRIEFAIVDAKKYSDVERVRKQDRVKT